MLVTDHMMPGIDGGELVRRAAKLFPGLPALVVTGYADAEVLRRLPPRAAVVRKPLRGADLVTQINLVLEQGGAAAAVLAKQGEHVVSPAWDSEEPGVGS